MSANVAYDPRADDEARAKMLASWGIVRPKPGADVVSLGTKRRPLGLAPAGDASESSGYSGDDMDADGRVTLSGGYSFSFADGVPQSTLDLPADINFVYHLGNGLLSTIDVSHQKAKALVAEVRGDLKARAAELQLENAQLRATLAEIRAKVDTLMFVTERLRVENAGPIGPQGLMGRDGRPGERGPKGDVGRPGAPGPRPVSWDIDAEQFAATELLSDGRRGPTLHLRALFETFNDQINDADTAEEIDVARAMRDQTEREAEAARRGLPPPSRG